MVVLTLLRTTLTPAARNRGAAHANAGVKTPAIVSQEFLLLQEKKTELLGASTRLSTIVSMWV
jgi:hypothetical protein